MLINNDFDTKHLTKERLIEILSGLPDNAILMPNDVKNLAVYSNASDCDYLGYIDFQGNGEYDTFAGP